MLLVMPTLINFKIYLFILELYENSHLTLRGFLFIFFPPLHPKPTQNVESQEWIQTRPIKPIFKQLASLSSKPILKTLPMKLQAIVPWGGLKVLWQSNQSKDCYCVYIYIYIYHVLSIQSQHFEGWRSTT